jgi:hypothetical protein
MLAVRSTLWLVPLFCYAVALAQEEAGKDAKTTVNKDEAEVQFANGSTVRMSILQEKIDVLTRYGKLSVPLAEIQRIEFGVHLPAEVAKQVDEALAKLASVHYAEREEGSRELAALGGNAYCALLRAQKSSDQEVARRAEKVLADIRARIPEKELRSREDDVIVTPAFTIVGRIVSPALKGRSEYFGNVQLQLPQMRQLKQLHQAGEIQLALDASQYGSAHGQWMESGVSVETSTTLLIVASGTIDIYPQTPGQYLSTPKGYGNIALTPGARVVPTPVNLRNYAGALFGRVGDNGDAFYIGERYEGAAGKDGKLYLHIVPSPWNNASVGSYQLKIIARN